MCKTMGRQLQVRTGPIFSRSTFRTLNTRLGLAEVAASLNDVQISKTSLSEKAQSENRLHCPADAWPEHAETISWLRVFSLWNQTHPKLPTGSCRTEDIQRSEKNFAAIASPRPQKSQRKIKTANVYSARQPRLFASPALHTRSIQA